MLAIAVTFEHTLGANGTISIQMDKSKVRKAVLILLGFNNEENLLAILMHNIIIGIDFIEIRWTNHFTNIA
ncbi:hypothetical protein D3C71_2137910 [compost metagenome]